MDTQDLGAPRRAEPALADHPPRSGVVHDNVRHTANFTVVGNHLAQHPELSLLAIGLGCHIQSVRAGTPVDIKSLAARFTEGTARISAALRELEAHGYLRRERRRAADDRIVTRTVSCNDPRARRRTADAGCLDRPARPARPQRSGSERTSHPRGTGRKALPTVPQPSCQAPALLQTAVDLLADLRRHDSRSLFSATETAHLAPGVAAWLERDVRSTAVRHALTTDLPPEGLRRPAALLAHRLTASCRPHPRSAPRQPHRHLTTPCATATAATEASAPPKQRPTAATAGSRPGREEEPHACARNLAPLPPRATNLGSALPGGHDEHAGRSRARAGSPP